MENEFREWALQFATIQEKHIAEFAVHSDISLHEMKRLFSEKYQDRIAFSYVLGVEKKELCGNINAMDFDQRRIFPIFGYGNITYCFGCYGVGTEEGSSFNDVVDSDVLMTEKGNGDFLSGCNGETGYGELGFLDVIGNGVGGNGYGDTNDIGSGFSFCGELSQYDCFELLEDLNPNITKGMRGVILEVWEEGAFEVEFVKANGMNFEFENDFTFTVKSLQIRKV